MHIVRAHLKEHGEQYQLFHTDSKEELLCDYEKFLETREFNENIVDILSRIAADALFVNIYIYQETNGLIYMHKFCPSAEATKKIYLQFIHDKDYPLANHYNAVIIKKPDSESCSYPEPCSQSSPAKLIPSSEQKITSCNSNTVRKLDFPCVRKRSARKSEGRKMLDRNTVHLQYHLTKKNSDHVRRSSSKAVPPAVIVIDDDSGAMPPVIASREATPAEQEKPVSPISIKEEVKGEETLSKESSSSMQEEDRSLSSQESTSTQASAAPGKETKSSEPLPPPAHISPRKAPPAHGKYEGKQQGRLPVNLTVSNLDILASVACMENYTDTSFNEPLDLSRTTAMPQEPVDLSQTYREAQGPVLPLLDVSHNAKKCHVTEILTAGDNSELTSVHGSQADALECPDPLSDDDLELLEVDSLFQLSTASGASSTKSECLGMARGNGRRQRGKGMKKNDEFPMELFEGLIPEQVDCLPEDIDGLKFYLIHADAHEWHEKVADRRNFKMCTCQIRSFNGARKMGWCENSFECVNKHCPFLKTSPHGTPNTGNWTLGSSRDLKFCYSCETVAERKWCGARKLVEYSFEYNQALVYHVGHHTCTLKPPSKSRQQSIKRALQGKAGKVGPAELQRQQMMEKIMAWDIAGAYQAANDFGDWRLTKNTQDKQVAEMFPNMNSFDAVGKLKVKCDHFDKYWLHTAINGELNNEADLIIQTSLPMLKLALQMDKDNPEDSPLKTCPCYFDAVHMRVQGFKSFAIWIAHPALLRVMRLASMEIRTENSRDIIQFFETWNKCLAEVKGDPNYKFNPVYFLCDEAGPNFIAIKTVFGKEMSETRAHSCYWHFLRNAKIKCNDVPPEMRERFMYLCTELANNPTVKGYEEAMAELRKMEPKVKDLHPWLNWWDARKSHVFAAFCGAGPPGANLAEVANAGWKRKAPIKLVDSCMENICTMVAQEVNLQNFYQHRGFTKGDCPTQAVHATRERKKQMSRAYSYLDILGDEEAMLQQAEQAGNPASFTPGEASKHRPPKGRGNYGIQGSEGGNGRGPCVRRGRGRGNRGRGRGRGRGAVDGDEPQFLPGPTLERQMELAHEVLGEPITNYTRPLSERPLPNHSDPPMVDLVGRKGVRKCQGCGGEIKKEEIRDNLDMVFKRKGVRGFYLGQQYHQYQGVLYYHFKLNCINRKEPAIEPKDITVHDDIFLKLSAEQFQLLNEKHYLPYILANKQ